ncbi:MAG: four helix bundle protein [Lacipirellulaceae bacterium]
MGEKVQSHHDLKVWQLGMEIAESVYRLTSSFPREEVFGLTSQLRRAATSVPANIAEGNGRDSAKDYLRHLAIAVGSLCEADTVLRITSRVSITNTEQISTLLGLIEEEGRMLRGLQRSLRRIVDQP